MRKFLLKISANCDNIFSRTQVIKKTTNKKWFSGEMFDENKDEYEWLDEEEFNKKVEVRLKEIEKAQKYTPEELDRGSTGEGALNINILNCVKIP